ncbi:MAG: prolipoprotein diacylglyceryl transferase [Candidatus Loosdrechtia sp.]|uniref:prolipoprotein diacylglyceryl transferase n=1 Tax=Candidatus Loosdrechtia sp. TaxID=3101272 RepID=UPI003A77C3DB|nr:MAG: prolipoprotein diacylglyceryl transferase [Candidatus Jettenia sp. AMX2]
MRKILFEIPIPLLQKTIPVYSYGFMLMIAFLIAIYLARWRAQKENIDPGKITDLGIYMLCGGIFGARLFFVIQFFDSYKDDLLSIFKIYEGGLVYYGGLLAAFIVGYIFVKKHQWPFLKVLDILIPSGVLGLAFGRIGCFLNGCCFGKIASHLPWAVQFPRTTDKMGIIDGSPAFLHHYELGLVQLSDTHSLSIHPTQLYSFFLNIALFFTLSIFFKYRRKEGEVFLLFGILYPVIRFFMESLRGDNPLFFNYLTIAQIISIFIFAVSLTLFIILRFNVLRTGSISR